MSSLKLRENTSVKSSCVKVTESFLVCSEASYFPQSLFRSIINITGVYLDKSNLSLLEENWSIGEI